MTARVVSMRAHRALQDLRTDGMRADVAVALVAKLEGAAGNLARFAIALEALSAYGFGGELVTAWLKLRGYYERHACPVCDQPILPKSTVAHDRFTKRDLHEHCAPERTTTRS